MNSQDILSLKTLLEKDEAEMLSLTLKLNNLLRLKTASPERTSQIESVQESLELVHRTIRASKCALEAIENSNAKNAVMTSSKFSNLLRESGFPRFTPSSVDVLEYTDSYELACKAVGIPFSEMTNVFILLIPFEDTSTLHWVTENIQNLNWDDWKKLVVEHYQNSSTQRLRETRFLTIKRKTGESLNAFCDRFLKERNLARLHESVELCKTLFLSSLPANLSQSCTNLAHTCSNVEDLAILALNIQSSWDSRFHLSSLSFRHSQTELSSKESNSVAFKSRLGPQPNQTSSVPSTEQKKASFCFYCKARDHRIEDCSKIKTKQFTTDRQKVITASCSKGSDSPEQIYSQSVITAVCQYNNESLGYPSPGKLTSIPSTLNGLEVLAHLDSCSKFQLLMILLQLN